MAEAANDAGRHLDAAAASAPMRFRPVLGAQDRCRRAIGERRAHRQRDRVGDRRRCEHFLDAEGLAELRVRVVHRVLVVLRAHGGDLPLRGAVGLHVPATQRGVDRHELAVRPVGLRPGWRRDALTHLHQRRRSSPRRARRPSRPRKWRRPSPCRGCSSSRRRCASATSVVPALRLCTARLKRRTARGAGVLDVVDRDALDADLAEDDLAGDRDLSLQRAVGHAGVKGDAEIAAACSRRPGPRPSVLRRRDRAGCARDGDRIRSWRCRRRRSVSQGLLDAGASLCDGSACDQL